MSVDDEANMYSMIGDCPDHGDDGMRACSMCGQEFCGICFSGSTVCPDCAEQQGYDDDDEDEELTEDEELAKLVDDDDDVDDMLLEADDMDFGDDDDMGSYGNMGGDNGDDADY